MAQPASEGPPSYAPPVLTLAAPLDLLDAQRVRICSYVKGSYLIGVSTTLGDEPLKNKVALLKDPLHFAWRRRASRLGSYGTR